MVAKKVEAAFDPADEGLVRNSTEELLQVLTTVVGPYRRIITVAADGRLMIEADKRWLAASVACDADDPKRKAHPTKITSGRQASQLRGEFGCRRKSLAFVIRAF